MARLDLSKHRREFLVGLYVSLVVLAAQAFSKAVEIPLTKVGIDPSLIFLLTFIIAVFVILYMIKRVEKKILEEENKQVHTKGK